jgi:hypothetical protein
MQFVVKLVTRNQTQTCITWDVRGSIAHLVSVRHLKASPKLPTFHPLDYRFIVTEILKMPYGWPTLSWLLSRLEVNCMQVIKLGTLLDP